MAPSSSTTTTTSDRANSRSQSPCPRGHWRPGEDEKLRQLVEEHGPQNWNSIAEKLEGRSGWFSCTSIPALLVSPFSETPALETKLKFAHHVLFSCSCACLLPYVSGAS
ncbi:hypothetical protein PVAP13_3KG057000 [Panicum virgatum]|uniref:Uncharacterized protein n=1 Tax=Panicum virgatum TaxID=38727 RepID=A0A8T0UN02_PANVG|nr:hypothetical protein PVAP13_3KG057000 [Panicum virgatum]